MTCSFQWAYYCKPDSVIHSNEVDEVRYDVGRELAYLLNNSINFKNAVVVPALDSGLWYGVGISEEMGLGLLPALHKNKYSFKSFTLENQDKKEEVRKKHNPSLKNVEE